MGSILLQLLHDLKPLGLGDRLALLSALLLLLLLLLLLPLPLLLLLLPLLLYWENSFSMSFARAT